jgi:hypothetical protein
LQSILITGIGCTGKSTLRKKMFENMIRLGFKAEQCDSDYDRHNIPKIFNDDTIYIIEDIHATEENALFPLETYSKIIYLLPNLNWHLCLWMIRAYRWFESGKYSWDADLGQNGEWSGTGKRNDLKNIIPIIKVVIRQLKNRNCWISDDLKKIKKSGIEFWII